MNQRLISPFLVAVSLGGLFVALPGCEASLGDCDPGLAYRVAFQECGPPAYEGQALVETSCASTFCHTPSAVGEERKGAPAGLDFDVSLACGVDECRALDLQVERDPRIERLRVNQLATVNWAGRILRTVERGHMPPGAEGRQVVEGNRNALRYRRGFQVAGQGGPPPEPLPDIASAEGIEILRNWLACGAPVVMRTESPTDERPPGMNCTNELDLDIDVGECVVSAPVDLAPDWISIYNCVIRPECVSCHSDTQPAFLAASQLNLDTPAGAFDAMVGVAAAGSECEGGGTLVVPGDADASLLIQKLEARHDSTIDVCGDAMPTPNLDPVPQAQIDIIRAWIDAGAAGP